MVNKKFWLGILTIVLVLGMTVVGCDNGSTGSGDDGTGGGGGGGGNSIPSELVGSWGYSSMDPPEMFLINSNGSGNFGNTDSPQAVTWSATSSKLTLSMMGISGTFDWSISSGKLLLTNPTGDLASSLGVSITAQMNAIGPYEHLSTNGPYNRFVGTWINNTYYYDYGRPKNLAFGADLVVVKQTDSYSGPGNPIVAINITGMYTFSGKVATITFPGESTTTATIISSNSLNYEGKYFTKQ